MPKDDQGGGEGMTVAGFQTKSSTHHLCLIDVMVLVEIIPITV